MKILSFDKYSKILRLIPGNKRKPVKRFLLVQDPDYFCSSCGLKSRCKGGDYNLSLCGILERMFPESAELFSSNTTFNAILEEA